VETEKKKFEWIREMQQSMIETIWSILSSWKNKPLSIRWWLILIKVSLFFQGFVGYNFQTTVKYIFKQFLWRGNEKTMEINWVK